MTIDHPEVWRCLQIKSEFFKTNLVEVILSYFIIFNIYIYILYPHYPLKSITLPGLEETGPVAPPNTTSTAPNLSRFSQCLGQWRPSRRQKYLPEITQVFWVHPFCLVFSNTYIHYKYKYTYTIIYIYMYIFRHWMPGLFKASQRDQGRSNCLQGLVDHLWDPRLMGNPPARKWHDDMTSWNHVSLKMTQMDGFKSFKTAICWSICWFKLSSYPKKKKKPWDFCYFFLSIFAICRMVKIGFTGSPRP